MRKALLFYLLLVFPATAAMAGEGKVRKSPNAVKNEYIVVLHENTPADDVSAMAQRVAKAHGATVNKVWRNAIKGFFATMSAARAEALSHHPDVAYVEENAEMFDSTAPPSLTRIDPATSNVVTDNRLWHLDVLDQNSAVSTGTYSYCTDGSDVTVYVVDSGVMRSHREFSDNPGRVKDGVDTTGDPAGFPAWNPCGGPANNDMHEVADVRTNLGHGTGVASMVGGRNVGVARNANIVPIKTTPCAYAGALDIKPETAYVTGQILFVDGADAYYRVTDGGTTGDAASRPAEWSDSEDPCCTQWGGVEVELIGFLPRAGTTQMFIDGVDWILGPNNPNPKSPAVVTFSKYRVVSPSVPGVSSPLPGKTVSLEDAVRNLLKYEVSGVVRGITVIASANNQDGNACDTSPARLSRGNTSNTNDPAVPYKVITVGGTMLRNNPDANPATGGGKVNLAEPAYQDTKATIQARWRCHAGDSDDCTVNIEDASAPRSNPVTFPAGYTGMTIGSNGGNCVTLFAPAKNIPVADMTSNNGYRDPRVTGGGASGTSWSAPIVAGMAARILQNNQTFTIDQVYQALMNNTVEDLALEGLDPPSVTGTPRNVLRLTDVAFAADLPALTSAAASGPTTIALTATGTPPLSYELYEVNPGFDVDLYPRHAEKSTLVGVPQSSGSFAVQNALGRKFFIRAKSGCASADSRITTISNAVPPAAPPSFVATNNSGQVAFIWSAVANADGYRVERKVPSQPWTAAVTVTGESSNSANEPAPSIAEGVVLYRVVALNGNLVSTPSNPDVAWVGTFTEAPVTTGFTVVKRIHLIELRKAVNGLFAAGGIAPQFTEAEVAETALAGAVVDESHVSDLLLRLNAARTNSAVGLSNAMFGVTPQQLSLIRSSVIEDLRAGVK